MDRICGGIIAVVIILIIIVSVGFGTLYEFNPSFRGWWNNFQNNMKQVDDKTKYETRKQVEDTARAMIATYEGDKLTYMQYKDYCTPGSGYNSEKCGWADAAKMRANKTVSTYNNYILQNSYVWKDNIPYDIKYQLQIIN